jgi:LPS-assembly lipoprotein
MARGACLALVLALAAGCGFHLQGRAKLPPAMKTPYLEAPDRQTDFVQSLRHDLLSNGAHLAPEKADASAIVSILKDSVTRRVISVSAINQPNEYEVSYTVTVSVSSVTSPSTQLIAPQVLTEVRTYSFSEPLLLAKGHEEDTLKVDMARDLAERVMRLLASL